jgi:transcriptional regulator with XRE-family HTH domain
MDYEKQPPEPYPRRRGRTPKPTDHPIGRLIRERRLALGLSQAELAEKVGIGQTSVSLIALMEHGTLPPRRDVAEKLADVLGLDRDLLLEWSSMRVSPHMPSEVLQQRHEYDAALRDAWETNIERASSDEVELPSLGTPEIASMLARATGPLSSHGRSLVHGAEMEPPEGSPGTITVYPAGADPDRFRGKRAAYVSRSQVERLIQGKTDLVRPIAYLIDDEDLERLRRRPSYPETRPTFAVVSRPLPIVIDSREPYAIRFEGRVILAYCAWDGRELVVLEPPGHRGFARLKARSSDALEDLVVGQVVALSWFPL